MADLSLGCVPYLNAYPLICAFDDPLYAGPGAQVKLDVPSRLPALLDQGDAQAILVSSIECLRQPEIRVAGDVGIASQGPVLSVRLFSKKPLGEIESIALDQSSMTSNALVQILVHEIYGITPRSAPMPPDLDVMLTHHDAGLLIGDKGMQAAGDGLHIMDLGSAWTDLTGLPFVWALWLGHSSLDEAMASTLKAAAEHALDHLDETIQQATPRFGFSPALTRRYLTEIMDYRLTEAHFKALHLFGELCLLHNLVEMAQMPQIVFGSSIVHEPTSSR